VPCREVFCQMEVIHFVAKRMIVWRLCDSFDIQSSYIRLNSCVYVPKRDERDLKNSSIKAVAKISKTFRRKVDCSTPADLWELLGSALQVQEKDLWIEAIT
jgi:hypothetical protein